MHNKSFQEVYTFLSDKNNTDKKSITTSFYSPEKKTYRPNLVFLTPNIPSFVRDVTEHGNIGAIKKRVLRLSPVQLIQLAWWNKGNLLKLVKKDFATGIMLLIQIELLQIMSYQPLCVVLIDQVTDLSVALKNRAILYSFLRFVKKNFDINVGIMTNNLPSTLSFLSDSKVLPDKYFFPFNPSGYEMNPQQQNVEKTLSNMEDAKKCVAIIPTLDDKTKRYLRQFHITKILLEWLS